MRQLFNRDEMHLLINELDLKKGVEVGVQMGGYAKYLLQNTNMFLYLVDIWKMIPGMKDISNVPDDIQEQRLDITKRQVAEFTGRYEIIRKFSVDASKDFEDGELDFIYLDADHSYKGVMQDMINWYPKLRVGGVIAGHDFVEGEDICGSEFGVRSAVFDFLRLHRHGLHVTNDPYDAWPTWYFMK